MAQQTWIEGKVRWFDELKGEGLVRDVDGNSYYVHYSTIVSEKKRKTLKKNKKVEFKLLKDSHFTFVDKIREV